MITSFHMCVCLLRYTQQSTDMLCKKGCKSIIVGEKLYKRLVDDRNDNDDGFNAKLVLNHSTGNTSFLFVCITSKNCVTVSTTATTNTVKCTILMNLPYRPSIHLSVCFSPLINSTPPRLFPSLNWNLIFHLSFSVFSFFHLLPVLLL